MQATHFYIKRNMQILVFFVCFLCIYSDWVCHRQCVMFSLSAWLTISWWRARLASLWRGTGALESTSKWPKHTKEGLVVCVETIMMTDRMISAAAAVRQTGPDTHSSSQSAANSGQLYQSSVWTLPSHSCVFRDELLHFRDNFILKKQDFIISVGTSVLWCL